MTKSRVCCVKVIRNLTIRAFHMSGLQGLDKDVW